MSEQSEEFITSTKFSTIRRKGLNAIKTTPIDSVVKPHDPVCELAILKKLQENRIKHVIELEDSSINQRIVSLKFPYIKENLHQYLLKYFKKPRWNPYLLKSKEETLSFVNKLDINYAIDFFHQLSQALCFVHARQIIHRDVKLQNVLVDCSGTGVPNLVLTDFGIAYDVNNPQEPPENKITDVSTSIYKAPELLFSVKNYMYAIDIWALLILVSQLFQASSKTENYIPAFVDDGSETFHQGSDIRLISSIFHELGIPPIEEWPEVRDYGSPAFEGMFGSKGDGNYVLDQSEEEQRKTCLKLFPRLQEVAQKRQSILISALLRMLPFESTMRISSMELVELLES
ncbi:LAFE_0B08680g1_1 [Lachancea fermentati]|uniref:LAFE_0B08680g1_1 n=1 Tax=Lachancea fermentati TaxID=4955 RepID=A0A1G4M8C2_LACFM|nr:LAFE_0B08680g1_1 [Lachancea fermentati]